MRGLGTRARTMGMLAVIVVAAAVPARGENVPLHMVPKPVLDTVRARFAGATIGHAEKDRVGGGFLYEIAIRHAGQSIDVILTPEGIMLLIKQEIVATKLPAPVVKALADRYPQATYQVVEAVIEVRDRQETLAYYEVDLTTAQRQMREVRVSPDGRILRGER